MIELEAPLGAATLASAAAGEGRALPRALRSARVARVLDADVAATRHLGGARLVDDGRLDALGGADRLRRDVDRHELLDLRLLRRRGAAAADDAAHARDRRLLGRRLLDVAIDAIARDAFHLIQVAEHSAGPSFGHDDLPFPE